MYGAAAYGMYPPAMGPMDPSLMYQQQYAVQQYAVQNQWQPMGGPPMGGQGQGGQPAADSNSPI